MGRTGLKRLKDDMICKGNYTVNKEAERKNDEIRKTMWMTKLVIVKNPSRDTPILIMSEHPTVPPRQSVSVASCRQRPVKVDTFSLSAMKLKCLSWPFTLRLMSCSSGCLCLCLLLSLCFWLTVCSPSRLLVCVTWTVFQCVCVVRCWPSSNLLFPLGEAPKLHIIFLNSPPPPPLPKYPCASHSAISGLPGAHPSRVRPLCLGWRLPFSCCES